MISEEKRAKHERFRAYKELKKSFPNTNAEDMLKLALACDDKMRGCASMLVYEQWKDKQKRFEERAYLLAEFD